MKAKRWKKQGHVLRTTRGDYRRICRVASFRMLTGHDYLAKHLHRIRVIPSPVCTLCGKAEMDGDHLDACPALLDMRNSFSPDFGLIGQKATLYWTARKRIAEAANVPQA